VKPYCIVDTNTRLWSLRDKAATARGLSERELSFAESCLGSDLANDKANACEILLRASRSESTRQRAINTMEVLCSATQDEAYALGILTAMLYISENLLVTRKKLRDFAVRCGCSDAWEIRANAVHVLRHLANAGDTKAATIIKALCSDPFEPVRVNALLSAKLLGLKIT